MPKTALRKIIAYDGTPMHYIQLTGVPMSMTILSPEFKQLHPPVMCKDYIQDAFWSEHTGKKADIYGFKWSPDKMSISEDRYNFGLEFTSADWAAKIDMVISLLAAAEEKLGFKPSVLYDTDDKLKFIVNVSKEWVEQPIRISFLTLLFRIGTAYTPGEDIFEFLKAVAEGKKTTMMSKDHGILKRGMPRVEKMLKRDFLKQTYAQFTQSQEIHDMSGVANYTGA